MAKSSPENDADLFLRAVSDAVPLTNRGEIPAAPRPAQRVTKSDVTPRLLREGGELFCIRVDGVSKRQLKSLRDHTFRAGQVLDLHGTTTGQVRTKLLAFVRNRAGNRQLLVIVGKGLHSEDGKGLLLDATSEVLEGLMPDPVLALVRAGPSNGGAGALCVLLRRADTA